MIEMLKFFKEWLETLNKEQADKVDLFFDSIQELHNEETIVKIILKKHPNLFEEDL